MFLLKKHKKLNIVALPHSSTPMLFFKMCLDHEQIFRLIYFIFIFRITFYNYIYTTIVAECAFHTRVTLNVWTVILSNEVSDDF